MMRDIAAEIAALDQISTGNLAERYAELHGQPCRTRHRAYLIRKIAWRLQANAEGGLSERALRRAEEIANVADVRVTPPRAATADRDERCFGILEGSAASVSHDEGTTLLGA
jgi:hypothetical protein